MSKASQRSTKYLRDLGWTVTRVEQRLPIPNRNVTRDCFGIGDLLAMQPSHVGLGIALVQVTTGSNIAAHVDKVCLVPELETWLLSGGRFFLHGWAKRGPRGKRKVWTVKAEEIYRTGKGTFGFKVIDEPQNPR